MKNESGLWDQLRHGDEKAMGQIYNLYFDHLVSYGYRLTPHHELVEDSIQDLFVDLWKLHANLSPTDSIKNYLICSFRRKLFRKLKLKTSTDELSGKDDIKASEPGFMNELMESEDQADRVSKLNKALDSLSARQKEAIFLKYREGLDYDAICEAMDLKYQSVRNLISTGVIRIREYLTAALFFILSVQYIRSCIDLL